MVSLTESAATHNTSDIDNGDNYVKTHTNNNNNNNKKRSYCKYGIIKTVICWFAGNVRFCI